MYTCVRSYVIWSVLESIISCFSGKVRKNVAPGYSRFRTFIIICAVARDFDFSEWNRKNRQNRAWQTKRGGHVARKSVKKVASINDETTGILRCVFMVKSEIQSFEIVSRYMQRYT